MCYFFTFQVFGEKIRPKLNKIFSDLRFLLEILAILPKTSSFLCDQMDLSEKLFWNVYSTLGCINLVQKKEKVYKPTVCKSGVSGITNYESWKKCDWIG